MDKIFKDLAIGDEFIVYGDIHINYNFPKICKCIKHNNNTGKEIDGCFFSMYEDDIVSVDEKPQEKDIS